MIRYFTVIYVLLFVASCSAQPRFPVALSGVIQTSEGWGTRLYLVKANYYRQVLSPYEGTIVDSATIGANGYFSFHNKGWLQEKGVYSLFIQPTGSRFRNEIHIDPAQMNVVPMVLEPGKQALRLEASARALNRTAVWVEANVETQLMLQACQYREPLIQWLEQQKSQKQAVETDHEEETVHGNSIAADSVNASLDHFLDTVQSPLPAFVALRLRAPENEFRDRPEFFIQVHQRLQQLAPEHPWIAQVSAFLAPERLPVLMGEKMPAFALTNLNGDTLTLDSLQFKLILVDFWASWCAPCRKEIRQTLRPLYDEYHARGFEILGISIDGGRAAWENAIRKDGAIWPNVSDLEGDASPVRETLRFQTIPANYLLDREGRLLGRNLHGEPLREVIKKYAF